MSSEVSLSGLGKSYWSCKSISLSTAAGLLAVTAVALGVLGFLSISVFKNMGMIGNISLTAGGGVGLLILFVVSTMRYCHYRLLQRKEVQEEESEEYIQPQPFFVPPPPVQFPPPLYAGPQPLPYEDIWQGLAANGGEVGDLFTLAKGERRETRELRVTVELFEQIEDLEVFGKVAPHLTVDHLEQIPLVVRREATFPWSHFFNLPGIGRELRTLQVIGLDHLPLDELAEHPEEVEELLPLGETDKVRTATILQLLKIDGITALAPQMRVGHLSLMGESNLQHAQFPWPPFLDQPNIGYELRFLKVTSLPHFPWKEFVSFEKEIKSLFQPGDRSDDWSDKKTQELFRDLSVDNLIIVAPHLEARHLGYCTHHFNSDKFPWSAFLAMEDIGGALRRHTVKMVGSLAHFPWDELIKKPKELAELFSTSHYYINDSKVLYRQISEPLRQKIAPVLGANHVRELN